MRQRWMWATGATLLLVGCQPAGQGAYITGLEQQPVPQYMYPYQPPAAYQAPVAEVAPAAGPSRPAADEGEWKAGLAQVGERLQRIEKAMLRLDRRMQLVERNELNRMGGGEGLSALNPQEEQVAMQSLNIGPQYSNGFRPVSSDGAVTSSLQAAPSGASGTASAAANGSYGRRLPSLADVAPAAGKVPEGELSVWTVSYEQGKVWPEREQLPLSRDVVEVLRSGQGVTVFARGKHPQATEFRERVKALSRYLGKVASLESVPISAIPAPHLADDTIEIFATR